MAKKTATKSPKRKTNLEVWQQKYAIKDEVHATKEELEKVVRKAAKAANQRLLRLERSPEERHRQFAYKAAQHDIARRSGMTLKETRTDKNGRNYTVWSDPTGLRFKESTKRLSLSQLKKEYRMIREFMIAGSSTTTGFAEMDYKRYQTALDKGFKGSFEDFEFAIEKAFTEYNEALFDSNIIYESVTEGKLNIIDQIVQKQMQKGIADQGQALMDYLEMVDEWDEDGDTSKSGFRGADLPEWDFD